MYRERHELALFAFVRAVLADQKGQTPSLRAVAAVLVLVIARRRIRDAVLA